MIIAAIFVFERCSSGDTTTAAKQAPLGEEERTCKDSGEEEVDICKHLRHCENEANDPEGNDDRRCVSFSSDIQPIFDNRCTRCHNPQLFRGAQDLTAGNSYVNLVNHPTSPGCMAQVPGSVRVVPCDPAASMLWRKTLPDPSRCGVPMPFGSPGLGVIAPDEFALIQAWICQGARNN